MSSCTTILGFKAHLVLEDSHGAFEVMNALKLENGVIHVDPDAVNHAIDERANIHRPPHHRPVVFGDA